MNCVLTYPSLSELLINDLLSHITFYNFILTVFLI